MSREGLIKRFYTDIIRDYREQDDEKSVLFQYFKEESEKKEIPKEFLQLLRAGEGEKLADYLTQAPREKEKSDLYLELKMRNNSLEKGMITEADYYIWLLGYTMVHYRRLKQISIFDTRGWLNRLLDNVLQTESEREKEGAVKKDLRKACELILTDGAAVRQRLAGIKEPRAKDGNYLTFLVDNFANLAIHLKIKDYLDYSGYPLDADRFISKSASQGEKKKTTVRQAKKDFSLRLLEAFCNSEKGYVFLPKKEYQEGAEPSDDMRFDVESQMYFQFGKDNEKAQEEIAKLTKKVDAKFKEVEDPNLFIPLVFDTISGCIMGIFGKGNYRELASENKMRRREPITKKWCFDFLEFDQDTDTWQQDFDELDDPYAFFEIKASPYRLLPRFEENVGKAYTKVLAEFKRYCCMQEVSVREDIKRFVSQLGVGVINSQEFDEEEIEELPLESQRFFKSF